MMKKLKIISLISFLLVCFSTPALVAQDQLKILQYNVLEGFKNDSLIQDEYISGWRTLTLISLLTRR